MLLKIPPIGCYFSLLVGGLAAFSKNSTSFALLAGLEAPEVVLFVDAKFVDAQGMCPPSVFLNIRSLAGIKKDFPRKSGSSINLTSSSLLMASTLFF